MHQKVSAVTFGYGLSSLTVHYSDSPEVWRMRLSVSHHGFLLPASSGLGLMACARIWSERSENLKHWQSAANPASCQSKPDMPVHAGSPQLLAALRLQRACDSQRRRMQGLATPRAVRLQAPRSLRAQAKRVSACALLPICICCPHVARACRAFRRHL